MWIQCILVGALWGFTNALMRKADASYTKSEGNFLVNLLTNWRWIAAFLANQSASVLFYVTLTDADLSVAVPICQGMTLVFNVIGAIMLGEPFQGNWKLTSIGIAMVFAGTLLMKEEQT